ncbi:MAG: hypothetical protein IJ698_02295 [Prevotella sp.]|nr:hypothetical protein [Prevotella sp.]
MEGYIDRIMQIPILRNFDPIELQSLIESGAHRFRKKKRESIWLTKAISWKR